LAAASLAGSARRRSISSSVIAFGVYLSTFGETILAAGSARITPSLSRKWQKDLIAAVLRATVEGAYSRLRKWSR
jgi:hypothetical protein